MRKFVVGLLALALCGCSRGSPYEVSHEKAPENTRRIVLVADRSTYLYEPKFQPEGDFNLRIQNRSRVEYSYWEVECDGLDANGIIVHSDMSNGTVLRPGASDEVRTMYGFNNDLVHDIRCFLRRADPR